MPLIAMLALAATIGLAGCEGDDGQDGEQGPPGGTGQTGPTGPTGPAGGTGPTGPGTPTAGDSTGLLRGDVTKISIAAGAVTVEFEIKDAAGNAVTVANGIDFEFGIAKLMPRTDLRPMYWQSLVQYSTGTDGATQTRVLRPTTERANTNAALTNRSDMLAVAGKPGTYSYTYCTNLVDVGTFQYYGNTGAPAHVPCGISTPAGVISNAAGTAILGAMNLGFDPAATYRVYVGSRNSAYHYNAVKDFQGGTPGTPLATLANQVVTTASCGACHGDSQNRTSLRFRNVESTDPLANIHGGNRFEAESCVICHNSSWYDRDASKADLWVTSLDLPQLVHKLHGGDPTYFLEDGLGRYRHLNYYPQDLTNCRTCHDNQRLASVQPAGRPDVDKNAWKDRPSQQACLTCHNGQIASVPDQPFPNHYILQNPGDNSRCLDCHDSTSSVYAGTAHITTPNISTPNSPELKAGYKKLEYEIKKVALDADRKPIVTFRVRYQDRDPATGLPDGVWKNLDVKSGQFADGTTFTGGPSFRITWSGKHPQPVDAQNGPAIDKPFDYNNAGVTSGGRTYFGSGNDFTATWSKAAYDQPLSVSLANASAGLSVMDAEGYFTTAAGIHATTPVAFPVDSTLRAIAIEGGFTFGPPLNPAVSSASPNNVAKAAIKAADGSTARRDSTNDDACLLCHERLILHGGSRVDNPDQCVICHTTEMTSSNTFAGWIKPTPGSANNKPWLVATPGEDHAFEVFGEKPMNLKDMLHKLHGQGFNGEKFNFLRSNPNATSGGANAYEFEFVKYPARLDDCQGCHVAPSTTVPSYRLPIGGSTQNAGLLWTVYGAFPGLSATTAAPSFPDLMTRTAPTTAACGTCHDDSSDQAHFAVNTSFALGAEACDVCHGPGRSADPEVAHSKRNQ